MFKTGKSGNPNGRPKGTGNRQQLFNRLVIPHQDALFGTAINLALNGNEPMLRLLLERLLPPKPIDEPISIKLPKHLNSESVKELGDNVLRLLEKKEITPEEAKSIFAVLKLHKENFQFDELLSKMAVFELWMKDQNEISFINNPTNQIQLKDSHEKK